MNAIKVKYVNEYLLDVWFEDGTYKQVNFANFLFSTDNPLMTKYRDLTKFKQVQIVHGHLSWGKNGDMDINSNEIYAKGELKGRKLYTIGQEKIWAYSMKNAKKLIEYKMYFPTPPKRIRKKQLKPLLHA